MHPILLHLGNLYLPTFGVLAAVGLMLALALSERTARLAQVPPEKLWNAGLFAVLAAFLLSRVLLVAAHWQAFRSFPVLLLAVPSLTAAGLLFTVAATLLWLWSRQIPILRALDAWAPCASLVWFFLALGHFAEGSDPGLATTLPWGLRMPGEDFRLHPVALYAALLALALTILLVRLLPGRAPGHTAGVALAAAGLAQFLLSFLREPGVAAPLGLDTLEWAALGMIVAGTLLLATANPRRTAAGQTLST